MACATRAHILALRLPTVLQVAFDRIAASLLNKGRVEFDQLRWNVGRSQGCRDIGRLKKDSRLALQFKCHAKQGLAPH